MSVKQGLSSDGKYESIVINSIIISVYPPHEYNRLETIHYKNEIIVTVIFGINVKLYSLIIGLFMIYKQSIKNVIVLKLVTEYRRLHELLC
jgi:hypothetical protein